MKMRKPHPTHKHVTAALLLVGALALALGAGGCATAKGPAAGTYPMSRSERATLRDTWGIEITSLRFSEAGHLVDFRYRVLDAEKAGMLSDAKNKPILIDQTTGMQMTVPNMPKMGPLRQSPKQLQVGRIYFMLFANKGVTIKPGGKVTIHIGDFKATDLTVE